MLKWTFWLVNLPRPPWASALKLESRLLPLILKMPWLLPLAPLLPRLLPLASLLLAAPGLPGRDSRLLRLLVLLTGGR